MKTENQLSEKQAVSKPLVRHLRRLYELEARIHDLDPWKWLAPADIFAIQREGYEPLFVCFNQINGFNTVDIGLGWRSYPTLLHVHTHKIHYPAFYFETRMFQFGRLDPDRIFAVEAENHAKLGPPGHTGRVPFFRSHQVGFAPWPVNRAEAMFLADVLYIIFGTAMRVEDFREPLGSRAMEEVYTVPMAADASLGEPLWVPFPGVKNEIQADVDLPGDLLKRVKNLPMGDQPMEIDHVFLPYFPGRRKLSSTKPPQTGYLFIFASPRDDHRHADVVYFTLHAEHELSNVWSKLPVHILGIIATLPTRPPEIKVTDSRLLALLRPLTEMFQLKLTRAESLPIIEREYPGLLKKMGVAANNGA